MMKRLFAASLICAGTLVSNIVHATAGSVSYVPAGSSYPGLSCSASLNDTTDCPVASFAMKCTNMTKNTTFSRITATATPQAGTSNLFCEVMRFVFSPVTVGPNKTTVSCTSQSSLEHILSTCFGSLPTTATSLTYTLTSTYGGANYNVGQVIFTQSA